MISDIGQAVCETKAEVVYICNIMTQRGGNGTLYRCRSCRVLHEHLGTVYRHGSREYRGRDSRRVLKPTKERRVSLPSEIYDFQGLRGRGCRVVSVDFIKLREKAVYHDGEKLSTNYSVSYKVHELNNNRWGNRSQDFLLAPST